MKRTLLATSALVLSLSSGCAGRFYANMGLIDRNCIRAAQPTQSRFERIKEENQIKSILNLRGQKDEQWYYNEKQFSETNQIDLYSLRMGVTSFPKKERLLQIVDVLENSKKPLLIHCERGADRTGFASVLYRHIVLKQPIEEAKEELSIWRGNVNYFPMNFIIDQYQEQNGTNFKAWVEGKYDKESFRKAFEER